MDILDRVKTKVSNSNNVELPKIEIPVPVMDKDLKIKQIKELEDYIKKEKALLLQQEQQAKNINHSFSSDMKLYFILYLSMLNTVAVLIFVGIILLQ